jgi:hypothetical protein
MSDIFITHIHEDEIVARALHRFLTAKLKGCSAQMFLSSDPWQLRLGDEWLEKIREALKSAKVILALFSPVSVKRPWVNFEAGGAWFSEGKVLVPLCIAEQRPENLPKPYSNIQGASLEEWNSLNYLVQRLWAEFGPPGSLSPIPVFYDDSDVSQFMNELERWKSARSSRRARPRKTRTNRNLINSRKAESRQDE